MAKRRKRKTVKQTPSDPKERYEWAITNGRELAAAISSREMAGVFPKATVGHFLLKSKGTRRVKEIYDYYSRGDIQQAIYKYAVRRRITVLRLFRPLYERLTRPQDVLPLTLSTLLERGNYWPSLHGTVSKRGMKGGQICDVVIEIDYKSSREKCFQMTRPVVDMLQDLGAVFRLKFSGHCSVHVIIPGEMLQIRGFPVDHSKFFRGLSDLVKKKLKEPRYLDTSFHLPNHYLRLAYSINESTGLVSLPFEVRDYDSFDPIQAQPKNVRPLPGWWSFPGNAPGQMQDFIRYVMRGQIILAPKPVAAQLPVETADTTWRVDPGIVRQARQRKREAAREFLPNEGLYDRMVRLGQDMIDLREFLLLEDHSSKTALRTLKHLRDTDREPNLSYVARRFDVDKADLKLLWDWDIRERSFRYYERDDIKQAIYELARGRKIRVGNEDKLFFLQEPADLMPLIVYADLSRNGDRSKYPAIYFTNSMYERTGEIPISCHLKIEFSTRREEESVTEAAMPVISLLAGFQVTFFMYFDGSEGPNIIVPYEAFPEKARLASVGHENILTKLSPHLKRSMRMPGATCTLVRDPHDLSIMPYSIHPRTGLACVPIQFSDLRSFSERDAWLGNVQVDNEWWDVPEDASEVTGNFLKQIAPLRL